MLLRNHNRLDAGYARSEKNARSCNSLVHGALMVNLLLNELEYDTFKLQNSWACRILTTTN